MFEYMKNNYMYYTSQRTLNMLVEVVALSYLVVKECHNSHKHKVFLISIIKELQTVKERKRLQRNPSWQNYCGSSSRSPCRTTKKVHWFLSHVCTHVCNGKFAAFWVLFPIIELYFY